MAGPAALHGPLAIANTLTRAPTPQRSKSMDRTSLAASRRIWLVTAASVAALLGPDWARSEDRPNIILVMADDQGWGQTGYHDHPCLDTPNLDAMAASGLRLERFYAGAPVCSPTRASVLTGRSNDRTGVENHGYALRLQEGTIAEVLRDAGYLTAHFGKWHLNGLRGPGVPILASDSHHPGHFGFNTWLSVTNFFDRDPILSRMGEFEEFSGDSSEIIVDQALRFIRQNGEGPWPFFAVIWYGTPHRPFRAAPEDAAAFENLSEKSRQHYGELVAMDRSIGTLRSTLRELGVADNTLIWFCSDNGGLPDIRPDTVGGLRGHKGTLYEGGLRVPAVIEWPSKIDPPEVTDTPACTMDIFPTLLDVAGIDGDVAVRPQDGVSLSDWFEAPPDSRGKPIPFRHQGRAAIIDNDLKLVTDDLDSGRFQLYDLADDPAESKDLAGDSPRTFQRLKRQLLDWNRSVEESVAGEDYPSGRVAPDQPRRRFWTEVEAYEPYFDQWKTRPEYRGRLKSVTE